MAITKFPIFTASLFAGTSSTSSAVPMNELIESSADSDEAESRRNLADFFGDSLSCIIFGFILKPCAVLCLSEGALLMLPWAVTIRVNFVIGISSSRGGGGGQRKSPGTPCRRDPRNGGAYVVDGQDNAWRSGAPGPRAHGNAARQVVDGLRTEVCGQLQQSNDPRDNQHNPNTPTTGRC